MSAYPFALQLYTVRDHMEADPAGTLKQVKAAGFDHVELAGTAGLAVEQFKALLESAGLQPSSAHYGMDAITQQTSQVIADCKCFGLRHVVMPYANFQTSAEWADMARKLDTAGAQLRDAGIRLSYHNHGHELGMIDGKVILDLILETAQPENLCAQLDTFWIKYAGAEPVAYIQKYAGRCPLIHIKDMDPSSKKDKPIFADLGTGTMDWPPIFAAAKAAGVEWYIVEEDTCPHDSLESARTGAAFMLQQ